MLSRIFGRTEEQNLAREQRRKKAAANSKLQQIIHTAHRPFSGEERENIRGLLREGGDINVSGTARGYEGCTLLHAAVTLSDYETTELLIAAGADVDAVAGIGASVLTSAIAIGNADVVRLLLDAGTTIRTMDLSIAKQAKKYEIAEMLEKKALEEANRQDA